MATATAPAQPPAPPPQEPETYTLRPTPHIPNSPLPVLVYRAVLPLPPPDTTPPSPSADQAALATQHAIERNAWHQGGIFKTYPRAHFHSVTHETYAVFRGAARMRLGVGPRDSDGDGGGGTEVALAAGDVIVLPAGVAHCNTASEGDYTYAGLYPAGAPRYDNNWGTAGAEETAARARVAAGVPVPECDPVFGRGGPLCRIWGGVAAAAAAAKDGREKE